MADETQQSRGDEEAKITLGLLNAVEANSTITQRSVASDLGIALGLANAYLKRCVRKGLVKVTQVPANRYAYYLTPQGFAEKSRLTAAYLSISFNFFRDARSQCAEALDYCLARGFRRLILAGTGDLGEIATLCVADRPVELICFVDRLAPVTRFAGRPVYRTVAEAPTFDAVLVTDFRDPQGTFDALAETVPLDRLVAPKLLRISRERPTLME